MLPESLVADECELLAALSKPALLLDGDDDRSIKSSFSISVVWRDIPGS